MPEGWIKLHRKIVDNPLWTCEPFTRGQAWVDLILLANHEYGFYYKRGVKIEIQRGQTGVSEVGLSDRWKWSRSKVRKFLKDLEKEQQIKQQKTNVTQIVTILNYEIYQQKEHQIEQQKDTRRTPKEHQKDTNKNDKNKENDKKIDYSDFLKKFNEITGKRIRVIDDKTKRQLNARINTDGFTMDEIHKSIENCKNDKYHIENPKYLTPEFITRSDKLQKYLNTSTDEKNKGNYAGRQKTVAEKGGNANTKW